MVKEHSLLYTVGETQSFYKPGQKALIAARNHWDTQPDRAVATPALCFRKTLMRWRFCDGRAMKNGHTSGLQRPN